MVAKLIGPTTFTGRRYYAKTCKVRSFRQVVLALVVMLVVVVVIVV